MILALEAKVRSPPLLTKCARCRMWAAPPLHDYRFRPKAAAQSPLLLLQCGPAKRPLVLGAAFW
jgi:hypothetical protein